VGFAVVRPQDFRPVHLHPVPVRKGDVDNAPGDVPEAALRDAVLTPNRQSLQLACLLHRVQPQRDTITDPRKMTATAHDPGLVRSSSCDEGEHS